MYVHLPEQILQQNMNCVLLLPSGGYDRKAHIHPHSTFHISLCLYSIIVIAIGAWYRYSGPEAAVQNSTDLFLS